MGVLLTLHSVHYALPGNDDDNVPYRLGSRVYTAVDRLEGLGLLRELTVLFPGELTRYRYR